ncbi:MAG: hypothetical protein R3182_01080, partial [Draconibacterium sp.]|nr:hypothetical protein [Draconibacterium sp.]
RPDKYLSAAGYEMLESSSKKIKIRMMEDGPLVIWCKDKIPVSDNFSFKPLNKNGLWYGTFEKENDSNEYIIGAE